jgi:hypothetical protein
MSRRFQFSLRDLLWLVLVVAGFLGGIRFEQERRRREDERNQIYQGEAVDYSKLDPEAFDGTPE